MRGFQDLLLRSKLMVIMTSVSALVLISTGMVFVVYESIAFRQGIAESTETTARMLGLHCVAPIELDDARAATEALVAALSPEIHVLAGALYRGDGTCFATYRKDVDPPVSVRIPEAPYEGYLSSPGRFEHCHSIVSHGKLVGAVYLCVDLRWHRAQQLRYVGMAGGVFVVMVLVAAALSLWAQRIFTTPIAKITRVAKSIVADEVTYSARVPGEDRTDELGSLVRSFNTMLAHIGESDSALQDAREELEKRVELRTRELIEEIKHRRDMESDLRMERDRAQKYLDMAGVLIVALDSEGRVTLLNRKGSEITGYSEEELLGCDWFSKMLPEENSDKLREVFLDSLKGGAALSEYYENAIVTSDGQQRLIAWHNTQLVTADREIVGVLSSGLDLTELHRAEEDQRRAQKLESIGTFAGGIAHDFNNFLMIIHGSIELAQMSPDCPPDIQVLLDDAVGAASRARGLTRQLITFARGGQPQKRSVRIKRLVRDAVAFVLTGSNVTAEFEVDEALWMTHVDTGQIEQVLTNLVVNAKQAMPDGGKIRVALANVDADAARARGFKPRRFVELVIEDEGVGISADAISNVFDPYFTTKKEGTGLGLATSYSIITKHEGHILVESQLKKGSTFHVLLPAGAETQVEEHTQVDAAKLSRSHHILLMDDEPMVADVIKIMLERVQCRATVCGDGREAVQLYAKAASADDPFDAVILDLMVPAGMGGKEASEKLLELDPYAKLIISSAYSNDPLMAEYASHGFRGCLAKPYDHRALERVLKSVLEGSEAEDTTADEVA